MKPVVYFVEQKSKLDLFLCVIFNLLFWRAVPSRLGLLLNENLSSLIIGMIVVFSLLVYMELLVTNNIKVFATKRFQVVLICFAIVLITVLFSYNEYSQKYLANFCKYVLIPLLILIEIKDYKLLLRIYILFALGSFFLLAWNPLSNNNVFPDYMAYGFELQLPCFIGLYLLDKKKKMILTKCLFVASFFLAFLLANRSCWISMLLFVIFYEVFAEKGTLKKIVFFVFVSILSFEVYLNLAGILSFFTKIADKFNIGSYSLYKLSLMLTHYDIDSVSSGRNYIYDTALTIIQDHFPFAFGMGKFEMFQHCYAHNIILDFMLNWGAAGLLMFSAIFIMITKSILGEKTENLKIVKMLFFSMWFPKLFFSTSFIYDLSFFASIVLIAKSENVNIVQNTNQKEVWK